MKSSMELGLVTDHKNDLVPPTPILLTRARARGWEFHACSNGDLGKFLLGNVCCAMENFQMKYLLFSSEKFLQILESGNYCLRLPSANSPKHFVKQFFKWS